VPLDLSCRSGADPIEHRSRTLFGLRRRDHDLAALWGGRRVRIDERKRSRCSRASSAAGPGAGGAATDRTRSRSSARSSAAPAATAPCAGAGARAAAGDGDARLRSRGVGASSGSQRAGRCSALGSRAGATTGRSARRCASRRGSTAGACVRRGSSEPGRTTKTGGSAKRAAAHAAGSVCASHFRCPAAPRWRPRGAGSRSGVGRASSAARRCAVRPLRCPSASGRDATACAEAPGWRTATAAVHTADGDRRSAGAAARARTPSAAGDACRGDTGRSSAGCANAGRSVARHSAGRGADWHSDARASSDQPLPGERSQRKGKAARACARVGHRRLLPAEAGGRAA